jgi:hypothetical protein
MDIVPGRSGITSFLDPSAFRYSVETRIQESATFVFRLKVLYDKRIGLRPCIVANADHLPTDLDAGTAAGNSKSAILDLLRDKYGSMFADAGKLITKI